MEKPYDMKILGEKLKKRGLNEGEDTVRGTLEDVCEWFAASAKLSPNPIDDLAAVGLPHLKAFALPYVDKIDGEAG